MPDNTSDYPPLGGQGFPADPGDGTNTDRGPDEYTRYVMEQRLKPRVDPIVGNLADLQRAGADAAQGISNTSTLSIAAPPGVDLKSDSAVSPAQIEAERGEWTRETERVGLLGSPPPNKGGDGHQEAVVVDPTSQGPVIESSPKSQSSTQSATKPAVKNG